MYHHDMLLVQVLERTQTQRPAAPAPEGPSAALQMWPTTLSISRRSSLQLPHGVSALSEPADRPLLLPSAAAMQAWDRMEAAEPPREPQQQQAAGWLQPDRIQPQQRDHGRLAAAAAEDGAVKQGDAASDGSGVEGEGAEGAAQGQQRWAQRRQAVGSGVGRAPGGVQTFLYKKFAGQERLWSRCHVDAVTFPNLCFMRDSVRCMVLLQTSSASTAVINLESGSPNQQCMHWGACWLLHDLSPICADSTAGPEGDGEAPEVVRQIAAHYEGSEGLARPATAAPSDRQRALRSEGSSLLALRPGTAGLVLNREGADGGLQAGLDGQLGAAGGPAVPEQVIGWCARQLGVPPVQQCACWPTRCLQSLLHAGQVCDRLQAPSCPGPVSWGLGRLQGTGRCSAAAAA